jgi:hypothetical protein
VIIFIDWIISGVVFVVLIFLIWYADKDIDKEKLRKVLGEIDKDKE